MPFKNVIGQNNIKFHLVEMVQQNRLSHALLFLGNQGSGALPLAIAFAQYVVCEKMLPQPKKDSLLFGEESSYLDNNQHFTVSNHRTDACGTCSACIKAQQLIHPDIHFSYPVIPKKPGDKPVSTDYINEWREFIFQFPYGNVYDWLQFIGAENKQGNITAQECNDIIRKLSLKSFEGPFKVLIMWMPEYLGNEGNKLLKLIEEPPPNTLFILVAENDALILPTIISRTQLVKIPALETAELEAALITRAKTPEDRARQVASIAEGNYREALQLLKHAEQDWQELLRDWLNAILRSGPIAQVRWIEEISKLGREKQKQFLRYFNHLVEQAIRRRVIGESVRLNVSAYEDDFTSRLNKLAGIAQQQAIVEELDKATYYIERNANAKILFHALTIKLYHIIADNKVVEVK